MTRGGCRLSRKGLPTPEQRDELGLSPSWLCWRSSREMGLFGDGMGWRRRHKGVQMVLVAAHHGQELASGLRMRGAGSAEHLSSAELFPSMPSSTFATIPVVPTMFCTSNISWSNSLQCQQIFLARVAFQSHTALSAQAGLTLPRWACIPLILHWPRCGGCSGGHWPGSHPVIHSAGGMGSGSFPGFAPTLTISAGERSFRASGALP